MVKKDVSEGNKIKISDITYFKECYLEILKANFIPLLILSMQDVISYLGKPEIKDENVANYITMSLFKKVYITDDGKITSIELEGLADYILNYLDSKIPNYLAKFKISIINRRKFLSLDPAKALEDFKNNSFRDVLSWSMFATQYEEDRQTKQLLEFMTNAPSTEIIKILNFLKHIVKTPVAFSNIRVYSIANKEEMNNKLISQHKNRGKNLKYTAVDFH